MAGKKTSISVGRLRYKVALQSAAGASDGAGGYTESWSTIANLFADIRPTGGDEAYRQGKVQDKVTHRIYIRYRSDIKTSYRISYDSRIFNIQSILNLDERDRWLELTCSEGEAA